MLHSNDLAEQACPVRAQLYAVNAPLFVASINQERSGVIQRGRTPTDQAHLANTVAGFEPKIEPWHNE